MATRSANTMSEVLQQILGELSQAKLAPDADIEFLLTIETQILQKLRQPVQDAMQSSGLSGQPGQPPQQDPGAGMGGMPGGMPGGMQGAPPAAPGVAGLRTSPGAPNPDELRRLLTQGQ